MKELSLNILDIAQNSISAEATYIKIAIEEKADTLTISVSDNGKGMSEEFMKSVMNPFSTTRTTRKVGMGIPLFKLAAEQTGGRIWLESRERKTHPDDCGTTIKALFYKNNVDFTPLGDIVSTIIALIQGAPGVDYKFTHELGKETVELDTVEMRGILGDDTPLNEPSVLMWIKDSLDEQYASARPNK